MPPVCEWCGRVIVGVRRDARFCPKPRECKNHFHNAQRRGTREKRVTARSGHERASSNGSSNGSVPHSRRPSRDGKGAKLYLLPHEIRELRLGPPYQPGLLAKLARAERRTSAAGR